MQPKRFAKDGFYGKQAWKDVRALVVRQSIGKLCPLCNQPMERTQKLAVDHNPPRRKLPKHLWLNTTFLQATHWDCHNRIKQRMEWEGDGKMVVENDGLPPDWH